MTATPWAETQRSLNVFNCRIRLAGPQPNDAADMPTPCEARVERQRSVCQRHHCADVFTEIREHEGSICQRARVVCCRLQGPPRQSNCLAAIRFWIIAVAVLTGSHVAERGPGERRPVIWISLDRLLH